MTINRAGRWSALLCCTCLLAAQDAHSNKLRHWPVQTKAQAGLSEAQDPATLPKSQTPPSQPQQSPQPGNKPALTEREANTWSLTGEWKLAEAPKVMATGDAISQSGFASGEWKNATVPGTVLTSLINDGVYPDPDFGLNNLAIPESLNKHDWWYRTEFTPPPATKGRHLLLTFEGINYAATVWLNGHELGHIKGAFLRGVFDVTSTMRPGVPNSLAVKISPPPHAGIPHEQSITAGPGENGGMLCLDGPTFICTEGWDWIPGVRDRNIGIWQPVTLRATGPVLIDDPNIKTDLPLPDTSHAEVSIAVPLTNASGRLVDGTLTAEFEGVRLTKRVQVPPGGTTISLLPGEFHQLSLAHPRLWWPNGYGNPELYHLTLSFRTGNGLSDENKLRFGVREISYELTLADAAGKSRRVDYSPSDAESGPPPILTSHEGSVKTADGWVQSLRPGAENAKALRPISNSTNGPDLVLKVNGVRIAARGGNWGMDDSRKRVSRERLEPYFRLHREAHLNIIRNWCGQNTEQTFYDLADEYGLLVWNDFWDSTQNYNLEPDDSCLFLSNARDTILRFRNHPSIALWCGRNEGVPSPAINQGLADLISELDGTRHYMASSNQINLLNSGPYKYQQPSAYFTRIGHGFAVEIGLPSFPTADALRAAVPSGDQWPPNDTWAYHDWHAGGNGDTGVFMDALRKEFGNPQNLDDFDRKAQMLNYESHRAVFEGFNARLWSPNSGRMLWMTHPSWPSTVWQIYSSDYDTQASFYAVQKACEPVHVQMNLPDLAVAVINNSNTALHGLSVEAQVISVEGKQIWSRKQQLDVQASSPQKAFQVEIPSDAHSDVAFVKLQLHDGAGKLLSDNFYWQAEDPEDLRRLNEMQHVQLTGTAQATRAGAETKIQISLSNTAQAVALMTKLTLHNSDGTRLLPAYLSENYISLLPGEKRMVTIDCPANTIHGTPSVALSGWNVTASTIEVKVQ